MTADVSVLVTVHNRESILQETIHSILQSQTAPKEVILVDDCSTDNSFEVCLQLAERFPSIKAYRNEHNLGDYNNRNRAASLATCKYLKYVDADDLLYPHSLGIMVDALEEFPDAALAISANVIDPEAPYPEKIEPQDFFRRHYFGRSPLGVGPSAAIIRRDCFDDVNGFSGRQFVGDSELWMTLAEKHPIVLLPPALVWWRRHEGQQMASELKRPEVLNIRFELELNTIQSTAHLKPEEKAAAQRKIRRNHARVLCSMAIRQRRFATAWQLYRAAKLSLADLVRGIQGYE